MAFAGGKLINGKFYQGITVLNIFLILPYTSLIKHTGSQKYQNFLDKDSYI